MQNNNAVLEEKIAQVAKGFGALVIELKVNPLKGATMINCMVDYPNGGINLETCASINKAIVHYLEDSKLLGEDFSIEVNSPGLDRKLKGAFDLKRISGRMVMLWFDKLVDGKAYWEGELEFIDDEKINLKAKDRVLAINIADIKTAKEKIVF